MRDTFELTTIKNTEYNESYMVIKTIFPIMLNCGMSMKVEDTITYEKYLEFRKSKTRYLRSIFNKTFKHFRSLKEIEVSDVAFGDIEGTIYVEVYEKEYKRDNKTEEYIFNM